MQRNGIDIRYAGNADEANILVYLNAEHSQFYDIFPNISGNFLDETGGIGVTTKMYGYSSKRGIAAVARNRIIREFQYSQPFIEHAIMEEVIQLATGIGKDSHSYPGSIFYDDPNNTPLTLLPIDEQVIKLMSNDAIKPDMTREEVRKVIHVTDTPLNN